MNRARRALRCGLALLRTERAGLRRDRQRTRLTAALVALPAAALAGGGTLVATARGGDPAASDGFEALVGLVLGGFGFAVAALVMGATFAIGLRRRRRELALVAANGADAAGLFSGICGSAALLGGAGSTLGVALGLLAAAAMRPWLPDWTGAPVGPLRASFDHAATALALGPLSALGAVAWPASRAARIPIRVGLGAQAPERRPSGAATRVGLTALVGAGVGLSLWARTGAWGAIHVLAASCLAVGGLAAATPGLLGGASRIASRGPLVLRLAARDAARFRGRNGAVITAIFASLALAVSVAALGASVDEYVRERTEGTASAEVAWLRLALVLSLGGATLVTGVATALAHEEAREDQRTLHTLGASPWALASLVAARAALFALLGAALAVPAGFAPAYGIVELADVPLRFEVPVATLVIVLVLFPAATFAGTAACAWARGAGSST